jgi:hypothetical protein
MEDRGSSDLWCNVVRVDTDQQHHAGSCQPRKEFDREKYTRKNLPVITHYKFAMMMEIFTSPNVGVVRHGESSRNVIQQI